MQLRYEDTMTKVEIGATVEDFRGAKDTVLGWEEPKHAGSTGRIRTTAGRFYPGVYGCKFYPD